MPLKANRGTNASDGLEGFPMAVSKGGGGGLGADIENLDRGSEHEAE